VKDYGVIRAVSNPYHPEGGIAILRGKSGPWRRRSETSGAFARR